MCLSYLVCGLWLYYSVSVLNFVAAVGKRLGKNEEQLPTVVYRLLRKSSANSRPTVGHLSADCLLTVGSMLVICRPSVG